MQFYAAWKQHARIAHGRKNCSLQFVQLELKCPITTLQGPIPVTQRE